MKNYDELIAYLRRFGPSCNISKDVGEATTAIQELQVNLDLAKSDAMRNAKIAVSFKAERDDLRTMVVAETALCDALTQTLAVANAKLVLKTAAAAAHKVERDGLKELLNNGAEITSGIMQRAIYMDGVITELRAKLAHLQASEPTQGDQQ
jgi:hypothetical protein